MKYTKNRKNKVKEKIIEVLKNCEKPLWTLEISNAIGKDDEFVFKILKELKEENIVIELSKDGKYKRRRKWRLNYSHFISNQKEVSDVN